MTQGQMNDLILHLQEATSINLYLCKGFKILDHPHDSKDNPGFDFSVENPQALAQQLRNNRAMAEDSSHRGHYPPWNNAANFGFTQVTQPDLKTKKWPTAVHVDFSLGANKSLCGIHLDHDHRVVGRDQNGNAVCSYANDPIVKYVIHEVGLRRIPLNTFNIRPILVYDEPEPLGFDFESCDIGAIEAMVQSLSTNNEPTAPTPIKLPTQNPVDFSKKIDTDRPFRHDNSRDATGWVGNRVTLGQGYREKGFGPRVHIELDQDSHLGNVHLDTHPYLNPDGTPDLRRAIEHGIYDLAPGFGLGGRTSHFTWQLVIGGSWTPKGSKESVEVGVPIQPAGDSGPIEGWTIGVGVVFRQRRKH